MWTCSGVYPLKMMLRSQRAFFAKKSFPTGIMEKVILLLSRGNQGHLNE
jgi:hypothetical protein